MSNLEWLRFTHEIYKRLPRDQAEALISQLWQLAAQGRFHEYYSLASEFVARAAMSDSSQKVVVEGAKAAKAAGKMETLKTAGAVVGGVSTVVAGVATTLKHTDEIAGVLKKLTGRS